MSTISVAKLKEKLQDVINDLNELDDDKKLSLESNTYFLNGSRFFVGISGYDGGYLDLDNVTEHVEEDDDDYDEEDNTEKFMLAIYSNGKKQGYVQCTDTKFVNRITYIPVFEKKHATVFTLYPKTDTDEAGVAWGSMTNDDAMCYSDFVNNFEPFTVVKESV